MTAKLTKPIEKVATITKHDLELHEQLGEEAREYERYAKAKRKQQADVKAKIEAWTLKHAKGKSRTVNRSGYRLSIVTVKKPVQWAKAFVTALGEAAAEKLRKQADTTDKLTIEKL